MGVLDNEWLLIFYPQGSSKLYKYKDNNIFDFSNTEIKRVKEMETYAKFNLQVFQYMLKHENTLSLPFAYKNK